MLRRGWKLMQETDAALGNAQHQPGVAHFDDHDPFPLRECHCVYPFDKAGAPQTRPEPETAHYPCTDAMALTQRERVVIVEVRNTWLVLGVAQGSVRLLHQFPAAPEHKN